MLLGLFEVSFFTYGPFGVGFVLTGWFFVFGPNICLALAIFAFYSGVINAFFIFYSGFDGGITGFI